VEPGLVQGRVEGLRAQSRQELARRILRQRWRPDHGAETARIDQPQIAAIGHEAQVLVRRRIGRRPAERKRTRHSQVDQEPARGLGRGRRRAARQARQMLREPIRIASQGQPQILAAARNVAADAAHERLRIEAKRPAQRQAHSHVEDPRVQQSARNAAARNFYFRQLGHEDSRGLEWTDMERRCGNHKA
jgi:hypothetical protein